MFRARRPHQQPESTHPEGSAPVPPRPGVAIAVLALSFYAIGYYTKRNREIELSVVRTENADLKDHLLRVK